MKLRTFVIIASPFVGYYYVDQKLSAKYPDIPLSQLPSDSKLKQFMKPKSSKQYFAYSDIYKTTVKSESLDQLNLKFLSTPGISNLVSNESKTAPLQSQVLKTFDSKNSKSTILEWHWSSNSGIVPFFETLSSYGYPWRMMNGGLHEILIKKSQSNPDEFDVWFSTTHEYNDKRDGKLIPNWVQSLHRNYARVLLYLATEK